MTTRTRRGKRLRVYVAENDRHQGLPVYEWLVRKAGEHGLAGATVIRGFEGFGADHHLHTGKILSLSYNLPMIVEIVDTAEAVDSFLPLVEKAVSEGLATVEAVDIFLYRPAESDDG